MIFAVPGHIDQIITGTKTQTRRKNDRFQVGKHYSMQPSRGKFGDPRGRILILDKIKENKTLGIGFPITAGHAKAEGNYTPDHYEALYEQLNGAWGVRYAYVFRFVNMEDIEKL